MLIHFPEDVTVFSFAQLFAYTLKMIPQSTYNNLTVVLGPVGADTEHEAKTNARILREYEITLSDNGLAVLCLSTFVEVYSKLLANRTTQGYPHEVLDEFIFPLLGSGYLTMVHMRENYKDRLGSSREHTELLRIGADIVYLN